MPKRVTVSDSVQKKYSYILSEAPGKHFAPDFKPDLTPKQMLALGVLVSGQANRFPSGKRKAGSIPLIHVAGSSSTVVTLWGAASRNSSIPGLRSRR